MLNLLCLFERNKLSEYICMNLITVSKDCIFCETTLKQKTLVQNWSCKMAGFFLQEALEEVENY